MFSWEAYGIPSPDLEVPIKANPSIFENITRGLANYPSWMSPAAVMAINSRMKSSTNSSSAGTLNTQSTQATGSSSTNSKKNKGLFNQDQTRSSGVLGFLLNNEVYKPYK